MPLNPEITKMAQEAELKAGMNRARMAATAPRREQSYLGGAIASTIGAIPELFGADPTPAAQQFREENPISGLATEILGASVPYLGVYKLSKLPTMATKLERATAAATAGLTRGGTIASRPVISGALREAIRYTPLEVARLAGQAVQDPDDLGEMFSDVLLSYGITGGIGAIGGYFRAGGEIIGKAEAASQGVLKPTYRLRSALNAPADEIADDELANLTNTVFTEKAPRKGFTRYVHALEGEDDAAAIREIDRLFGEQGAVSKKRSLERRVLAEGPDDLQDTLNQGEREPLLKALGFADDRDAASHIEVPRLLKANDEAGAVQLAKAFQSKAWNDTGEGVLWAKEADEGSYIVAKRIRSGVVEDGARGIGRADVAKGDQWAVFKTDRPTRVMPATAKIQERMVADWARMGDEFRPRRTDPANMAINDITNSMTPEDFALMQRGKIVDGAGRVSKFLEEKFPELYRGIANSHQVQQIGRAVASVVKPVSRLELEDADFGRMSAALRYTNNKMDEAVNQLVNGTPEFTEGVTQLGILRGNQITGRAGWEGHRPISVIRNEISPEARAVIDKTGEMMNPGKALDELKNSGILSETDEALLREWQAAMNDFTEKFVRPMFRSAGDEAMLNHFTSGYIKPRIWPGNQRATVVDEKGKEVWLAASETRAEAIAEAQAIIKEAADAGKAWKIGQTWKSGSRGSQNDAERLLGVVEHQLSRGDEVDAIIRRAYSRLSWEKNATLKQGMAKTPPKNVKERTGRRGTPDIRQETDEEVLRGLNYTLGALARFGGSRAWQQRFATRLDSLSRRRPDLHANITRRQNMYLGLDSKFTRVLDETLAPVLGNVLGNKPATRIAQVANETMFHWNLGMLNPVHALMNVVGTFQTVMPRVAFMLNASDEEIFRLTSHVPLVDSADRVRGIGGFLAPMKMMRQAWRDLANPDPELMELVKRGIKDSTLHPQLVETWVGQGSMAVNTIGDAMRAGGYIDVVKRISSFAAEKSESLSRMVAFNASYRVGKDVMKFQGEQLYQFTRKMTEMTMYNYRDVDRARLFTGPLGSVTGLFKNWLFNYMGDMMEYANLGVNKGVWSPLLWQHASTLGIGGLAAAPLKAAADGLARWHDAPNSYVYMQEQWQNQKATDAAYFGLPGLLGISLAASASMPGADVTNDVNQMFSFVLWERGKALGQAMGNGIDYWQASGNLPFEDPNIRAKMFGALSPRAFNRAFATMEENGITSMRTGYPGVTDVSLGSKIAYGFGFNPVEVEIAQRLGAELRRNTQKEREMVQNLGAALRGNLAAGDFDEATSIYRRATLLGIADRVEKSAVARQDRASTGSINDAGRKEMVARYQAALP